jgi:hypothetical protein
MGGPDPHTRLMMFAYTFSVSLAFALTAFVPIMLLLHWLF